MTLQHKQLEAEIKALKSIGLTKEAMEKEAFLGSLLRGGAKLFNAAKRGTGLGINRAANAFRSSGSPSKLGLGMARSGQRNVRALNLKGSRIARDKRNFQANYLGNRRQAVGLSRTPGRAGKPATAAPAPAPKAQVPTTPVNVGAPAGSTLTTGVNPGVMVGAPKTPTMPHQTFSRVPTTPRQAINPNAKAPFTTPNPQKFKKVPTKPLPPTDQQRAIEWAKKNPLLAAGGGLMGYKALNSSNGSDNIVVGR